MLNYRTDADYSNLKILYEDNHLTGVYKPPGILVQGDYSDEITMIDILRKYLAEKYNKTGNVYLGLVHRLDKPACGSMIFAKTSKAAKRLSEQFRKHRIKKIYYAIVEGKIKQKQNLIKSWISRNKNISVSHPTKKYPDSKYAELKYRVLNPDTDLDNDDCFDLPKNATLVEIELITGRKHQIRSQFASLGNPVWGDSLYGSTKTLDLKNSIALLSYSMMFEHPTSKEPITIKSNIPESWKTLS